MHVCGLAHVAPISSVLASREYIFRLLLLKVPLTLAVSCRSFVEDGLDTSVSRSVLCLGSQGFSKKLDRTDSISGFCARGGSFNRIDECGFLGELFTTLGGSRVRIPFAVD